MGTLTFYKIRTMPAKLARLDETAQLALNTYLTQVRKGNNPATFLGLTNAEEELYFGSTGERVFGQPGEVDENTGRPLAYNEFDRTKADYSLVLQLWSSTKLVTTVHPKTTVCSNRLMVQVAALQLVEQGRIGLDDEKRLNEVCPELARLPILRGYTEDGKAILEPAKRRMTLRMLLNHTCGESYTFSET